MLQNWQKTPMQEKSSVLNDELLSKILVKNSNEFKLIVKRFYMPVSLKNA